jgi:hypothetical protein
MEPPAQPLKDELPEPVAISGGRKRVVCRAGLRPCAGRHYRDARIAALHDLRQWPESRLPAVGELVFQVSGIGHPKRQHHLGRLEVDEPVAQGKISLAAPLPGMRIETRISSTIRFSWA